MRHRARPRPGEDATRQRPSPSAVAGIVHSSRLHPHPSSAPSFRRSEVRDPIVAYARVETQIGQHTLSLETGKLAKQAHGSVVVGLDESQALVAAVEGNEDTVRDFFPLVVDYREKTYSA